VWTSFGHPKVIHLSEKSANCPNDRPRKSPQLPASQRPSSCETQALNCLDEAPHSERVTGAGSVVLWTQHRGMLFRAQLAVALFDKQLDLVTEADLASLVLRQQLEVVLHCGPDPRSL
jgi:hypothetical protein